MNLANVSLAIAGLLATTLPTGCAETENPGADAQDTSGDDTSQPLAPPMIDMLWVIDSSPSMCAEQRDLALSFPGFVAELTSAGELDLRVAVTSTDVLCDTDNVNVFATQGAFNTVGATQFPPPCQERRERLCMEGAACANMDCVVRGECAADDPDCTCAGELGEWGCRHSNTEVCQTNPNGSVNSYCVRRCTTDEDCRQLFGADDYFCQKPSNNTADWGCMAPPATAGCPGGVPPVLDGTNLDLFRCAVTVQINQGKCKKYEQGMSAALMALEPDGPNAAQATGFLRDGAWLVVVFVSDEDDCSTAPGQRIDEVDYDRCWFHPTTDDGGPLLPIAEVAARLRALRPDPDKVIVAAIGGDSLATDPAQVATDREAFQASLLDAEICYQQSTICGGPNQAATWAPRTQALAAAFGDHGVFTNICVGDSGLAPALVQIADAILRILPSHLATP